MRCLGHDLLQISPSWNVLAKDHLESLPRLYSLYFAISKGAGEVGIRFPKGHLAKLGLNAYKDQIFLPKSNDDGVSNLRNYDVCNKIFLDCARRCKFSSGVCRQGISTVQKICYSTAAACFVHRLPGPGYRLFCD